MQTIGSAGESLAAGGVIWLLIDGERLIDEVRAENIGCEYGEYC